MLRRACGLRIGIFCDIQWFLIDFDSGHTVSQRLRKAKKIPLELYPLGNTDLNATTMSISNIIYSCRRRLRRQCCRLLQHPQVPRRQEPATEPPGRCCPRGGSRRASRGASRGAAVRGEAVGWANVHGNHQRSLLSMEGTLYMSSRSETGIRLGSCIASWTKSCLNRSLGLPSCFP